MRWWLAAAGLPAVGGAYAAVDETEVARLVASMGLREKTEQTCSFTEMDLKHPNTFYTLANNDRLKIQGLLSRDGPRGITCWSMIDRANGGAAFASPCPEDGTTPSFPSASLRGASWDVELEWNFGQAIGQIAKRLGVNAALLPSINLVTWLGGGRGQEMYGEDPVHVGKMGAAAIRGIQADKKVMACAKHFTANNVENTRFWLSADMDDAVLNEVYMKAWAIVIAEASPELVMTAYNRVQGEFPFTSKRLLDLLRRKYGFDGSVITDWLATFDFMAGGIASGDLGKLSPFHDTKPFPQAAGALLAGLDMELPFCNMNKNVMLKLNHSDEYNPFTAQEEREASKALDAAVTRVLRSKQRFGLLNADLAAPFPRTSFAPKEYADLALWIAQRGIVLLRNEAGFLPKKPADVTAVVTLGPADQLELGDHGSSWTHPSQPVVSVLDGLRAKYGLAKVKQVVTHANASHANPGWDTAGALALVRAADVVVVAVGLDWSFEGEYIPLGSEGGDRKYLTLHPEDVAMIRRAAGVNPRVVVVATAGMNIVVEDILPSAQAILWLGYPGPLGGQAVADILAGDINPSGRMPCATPKAAEDFVPAGVPANPGLTHETIVRYPSAAQAHGFKHMWGAGIEPRYPMGWGLGYTSFVHGTPQLTHGSPGMVVVSVSVNNTGALTGIETVQVYGTCKDCVRSRSPVVLLGFAKVEVWPGTALEVKIPVSVGDLGIFDPVSGRWLLEKGTYSILAGSCGQQRCLRSVEYTVPTDAAFDYPAIASAVVKDGSTWHFPTESSDEPWWRSVLTSSPVVVAVSAFLALVLVLVFCLCRRRSKASRSKGKLVESDSATSNSEENSTSE